MRKQFQTLLRRKRLGFTLVELAIVLSITALLAAGLWRMMAAGNTQVRDQAAADQQRDLINATRAYLASSDGTALLTTLTQGGTNETVSLPLPASCPDNTEIVGSFCNFLPEGFTASTVNSYGQNYAIQVKGAFGGDGERTGYSFMIKTEGGEIIPDTSGGRISSTIGSDGGFVYDANVCGDPGARACGAFGTWSAMPVGDYNFGAVAAGQVASRTFVGTSTELNAPWLARVLLPGDSIVENFNGDDIGESNTLRTSISLSDRTIVGRNGQISLSTEHGNMPALEIITNCETDKVDGSECSNVAEFRGPVSVDSILKANLLFAGQFVYESPPDSLEPSDERLKNDIQPLTDMLGRFSRIKAYSFYLKEGGPKKYGLIAQEIEKEFPEVVTDIGNGYKGLDYMGLVGPVIGAVNELRQENEKLKAELEALAKEVEALKGKAAQ
ncbi:MAG: tail fiber domain-containing protein [Alphaproteobacteria bacterium]|nr:tail fiber domain-containing protein [Alphaproteobacteria bacterium]